MGLGTAIDSKFDKVRQNFSNCVLSVGMAACKDTHTHKKQFSCFVDRNKYFLTECVLAEVTNLTWVAREDTRELSCS